MHIRLIAVGDRQPSWVDSAFNEYAGRLPRQWRFALEELPAVPRTRNAAAAAARDLEAVKILGKIRPRDHVVVLDEKGRQPGSRDLAGKLEDWQAGGQDVVFVIGGPDGVSTDILERANYTWSLSSLTLPHGLARVLMAEQLYRAWSILTGHPYHRD